MQQKPEPPRAQARPPLLRRADQLAVGLLIGLAVVAQAAYWMLQRRPDVDRIHIEHAEPLDPMFRVDVNTARWPELAQLPTVGETLAKRIVAYRVDHGRFRSHAELQEVEGIGPRTLQRIRPFLLPLFNAEDMAAARDGRNAS